MREAIGNAFVVNIVIIFLFLIMFVFVGSISYSKAFKIKNRIVNYIEEKEGKISNSTHNGLLDNGDLNVESDIDSILHEIGYQIRIGKSNCKIKNDKNNIELGKVLYPNDQGGYNYCIVKYDDKQDGYYYGVTTFMKFEIPIINYWLEFPVYGETKTFRNVIK